jgi:isoquinoline 1-oxidoreductase subunit beta
MPLSGSSYRGRESTRKRGILPDAFRPQKVAFRRSSMRLAPLVCDIGHRRSLKNRCAPNEKEPLPMKMSRRTFLAASAGGALVLSINRANAVVSQASAAAWTDSGTPLLARLRIDRQNVVTLLHTITDIGQGTPEVLAQIVADQLYLAWPQIRIEQAPVQPPFVGERVSYATAGSSGISRQFDNMRRLGATARAMLVSAAASRWNVPPETCETRAGYVLHKRSARRISYANLVDDAARLPVPVDITIRPLRERVLVGQSPPSVRNRAKVNGSLVYGIDVNFKGLRTASILQCPVQGGRLAGVDEAPALAVNGVTAVVRLADAVAVVAEGFWPAKKGLEALQPTWDMPGERLSSDLLRTRLAEAARAGKGITGSIDRGEGERRVMADFSSAAFTVESLFDAPIAAHATMEPQNATAEVTKDGVRLWLPTQNQGLVQEAIAKELGIANSRVEVNTTGVGGAFGRRLETDVALQAVRIAKAVGGPVKLIWTREQDIRHDFYRPAAAARFRAAIDSAGSVTALRYDVACSSILASSTSSHSGAPGEIDFTAEMGLRTPYTLPRALVNWTQVECGLRHGWWRSVGCSQNTFFVESFIDEIAAALKQDALIYRRELLKDSPRQLRVFDALVKLAKLDRAAPAGRHRGVAMVFMSGSVVALAAELSVEASRRVRLHQISCVMDCGVAMNPSAVRAQVESCIVWGLSACMLGEITIKDGAVEQTNFHEYPVLRLSQTPPMAIELVESNAPPGGAGEETVPAVAPAIANALFAATGERIRTMPFRRAGYALAV